MSGHSRLPRVSALQLLGALSLLFLAVDARAVTISPSPSYDGNYTVSWSTPLGCTVEDYPPFYPEHCYSLQEDGVDVAASGYSKPVTGKPAGSYEYRVYYRMSVYAWPYDEYTAEGPASVTVGTPPPRDPLTTQLNYQYETRTGDINWDGKTDIFVRRTSGGVAGNGTLEQVILRQNSSGGTFSILVPDSSQAATASAWPASSASIVVTDFNVDGFVDVEVKGVAAAVGVGGAFDQIVFSPAAFYQPQPLGLRAVDASLKQFVGNSLDYFVNPSYFPANATPRYFSQTFIYFDCEWAGYGFYEGAISDIYGDFPCTVYYHTVSGTFLDYAGFSQEAASIWLWGEALASGAATSADSTEGAQDAAEDVLGVEIGGWPMEEVLGATGEHTDANIRRALETIWAIIWIGRANAQEVETEEAPPQSPRLAGTIYLTGHPVAGGLSRHAALEYLSLPPYFTLSARNSNGSAQYGTLIKEDNWERDLPMLNMTYGTIEPPGQTTNNNYWLLVLAAFSNYDNDLAYDALGGQGFNSNGFIRGLLEATGGVSSVPIDTEHGFRAGEVKVPASAFY
jgi:hypothetical protein